MTIVDQIDRSRRTYCREFNPAPWGVVLSPAQLIELRGDKLAMQRLSRNDQRRETYADLVLLTVKLSVAMTGPIIASRGVAGELVGRGLADYV